MCVIFYLSVISALGSNPYSVYRVSILSILLTADFFQRLLWYRRRMFLNFNSTGVCKKVKTFRETNREQ